MSRRLERLTPDRLAALPEACRTCLFWEYDAVHRARHAHGPLAATAEKEAWMAGVLAEWGTCGQVLLVDDEPVAHVIYAPARFLPGAAGFPTSPVSADAVVLATAYVEPALRRGGLGRMLVQGMARDLLERGDVRAVEGFAARPGREAECVLPEGYWSGVGFRTHRDHPAYPRMRMDLRSALTWRDEVGSALGRLRGAVRPSVHPAPQPRCSRRT